MIIFLAIHKYKKMSLVLFLLLSFKNVLINFGQKTWKCNTMIFLYFVVIQKLLTVGAWYFHQMFILPFSIHDKNIKIILLVLSYL